KALGELSVSAFETDGKANIDLYRSAIEDSIYGLPNFAQGNQMGGFARKGREIGHSLGKTSQPVAITLAKRPRRVCHWVPVLKRGFLKTTDNTIQPVDVRSDRLTHVRSHKPQEIRERTVAVLNVVARQLDGFLEKVWIDTSVVLIAELPVE